MYVVDALKRGISRKISIGKYKVTFKDSEFLSYMCSNLIKVAPFSYTNITNPMFTASPALTPQEKYEVFERDPNMEFYLILSCFQSSLVREDFLIKPLTRCDLLFLKSYLDKINDITYSFVYDLFPPELRGLEVLKGKETGKFKDGLPVLEGHIPTVEFSFNTETEQQVLKLNNVNYRGVLIQLYIKLLSEFVHERKGTRIAKLYKREGIV